MWSYLENPFASLAKRSQKQFLLFTRDHRDKLQQWQTDPDIAPLFQRVQTAYSAFEQKYADLNAITGMYRTKTRIFENLIQELSTKKIKTWDIQVQVVYADDTPEYTGIFPNRRGPFQGTAYDLRINSLMSLVNILSNYPLLANVQTDVQTFLAQIQQARTEQQGLENNEQVLRSELSDVISKLASEMFYVYAMLLAKYYMQIEKVENFYELKYLRSGTQSSDNQGTNYEAAPNNKVNLYNGELTDNSYLVIKNTGNVPITVYTSNDPNAATPIDATVISPNDTLNGIYAEALTDGNGYSGLIVVNNDSVNKAKFNVLRE